MLATITELFLVFAFLFGLVIAFSNGMEWLTSNVSQTNIIAGFLMLILFALVERYLQKGRLCFTASEKKTIWGMISFILFFVFFAFAVMEIEDYGLSAVGVPSGFLGLLAMFMARHNVEGLNIPKKFKDDPEMKARSEDQDRVA